MRTRLVAAVCFAVMLPFAASAATVEELSAQLQSLITQLNAMKAQASQVGSVTVISGNGAQSSTPSASCPSLYRNLSRGVSGPDVQSLQRYLISLGMLAPGSDSGFFGPLTEKAVQQWQAKQGIVSSGTPDTTGYGTVGARTRSAITAQCSTGVVVKPTSCPLAPPPTSSCPTRWQANTDAYGCTTSYSCSTPLPGQPQTSPAFTGSPLIGVSPLVVSFVTKISNPTSYAGGAYQIDYGDGSFETIAGCSPSGVCSLDSGTHIHTYTMLGTFSARLVYVNRSACPSGTVVCAEKQEVVGTLIVTAGSMQSPRL